MKAPRTNPQYAQPSPPNASLGGHCRGIVDESRACLGTVKKGLYKPLKSGESHYKEHIRTLRDCNTLAIAPAPSRTCRSNAMSKMQYMRLKPLKT